MSTNAPKQNEHHQPLSSTVCDLLPGPPKSERTVASIITSVDFGSAVFGTVLEGVTKTMDAQEILLDLITLREHAEKLEFETPESNGLKHRAILKIKEAESAILQLVQSDDI